jgi:hypothetical protein
MLASELKLRAIKRFVDPQGAALVRRVRHQRLSYLSSAALFDLREAVQEADRQMRPGILIECGCALGGSAIVMAASRDNDNRPLYVYDVFGMIPPPGERDGNDIHDRYATIVEGRASGLGGDIYYGYKHDLHEEVVDSLLKFDLPPNTSNIHLVEGLFQDTVRPNEPVALAHVDGDWYESVMTCLQRIWPVLAYGGTMVIDDYFDWSGCRDAVDEFSAGRADCERVLKSRLHLVKH